MNTSSMDSSSVETSCPITYLTRNEIDSRRIYEVSQEQDIFYDVVALWTWIKLKPFFPHNRQELTPLEFSKVKSHIDNLNVIHLFRKPGPPTINGHGCITYTSLDSTRILKCFSNGHVVSKPSGYTCERFNPWNDEQIKLRRIPTFGEWSAQMSSGL